jgi:hypothetical protein
MYSEAFVKGCRSGDAENVAMAERRGPYYTVRVRNGLSTLIVCRELARSSGPNGTDYEPDWL